MDMGVLCSHGVRAGGEARGEGGSKRVVDLCDARLGRLVAALEGVEDQHDRLAMVNGMGKLKDARTRKEKGKNRGQTRLYRLLNSLRRPIPGLSLYTFFDWLHRAFLDPLASVNPLLPGRRTQQSHDWTTWNLAPLVVSSRMPGSERKMQARNAIIDRFTIHVRRLQNASRMRQPAAASEDSAKNAIQCKWCLSGAWFWPRV